jgi:CheY-like chemotaxis protein
LDDILGLKHMKPRTIFLVDDDVDDIFIFGEVLMEVDASIEFLSAENGEAAQKLLKSGTCVLPDLIFLDLNMPRMNGKELLREIKTDPGLKNIPVVVYTTSSQKKDREEAISSGAVAFLSKPSNMRDLKNALADLVGSLPQKPAIAPPAC